MKTDDFVSIGRRIMKWLFFAIVLAIVTACGGSQQEGSGSAGGATSAAEFRILASSEVKDLEPELVEKIRRATGVNLRLSYAGTLELVDRINSGEQFDAVLPAKGAYFALASTVKPLAQEKIMYSLVALGVKESKAKTFGWIKTPPTWADIAHQSQKGMFRYAMTNPASSNTGMSALLGLAAALAGKAEDLQPTDINPEKLRPFASGMRLTAGSSGWLAEAYLKDQDQLDGIINYESVLLSLNTNPVLREKLTIIYPQDGVISADYPLILLNANKREQYNQLILYIKGVEFQKTLMERTFRRPTNKDVVLLPLLTQTSVVELLFPARLETVEAVLFGYLDIARNPATSIFVLDVSGSMQGQRIEQLQKSLLSLTGTDQKTLGGKFSRFQEREKVILITFHNSIDNIVSFDIGDRGAREKSLQAIRDFTSSLSANGGTAIYSAVHEAYKVAAHLIKTDPNRIYSIVLMTDGQNTDGESFTQLKAYFRTLPPQAQAIRVFPVLFGSARPEELNELATMTGGRMFDATKIALQSVFKDIRGYQ